MKKLMVCLLAFLCVLYCAAFAEEPIAVRVEDRTFSRSEVQKYVNQTVVTMELGTNTMLASDYSAEDREELLRMAAQHFVVIGVMREKLAENGLEQVSEEEDALLIDYTRQMYEDLWQEFSKRLTEAYPDEQFPEAYVTEALVEAGYAMDDLYNLGLLEIQEKRLIDLYCSEIGITDEEVQAFYIDNLVTPDREKYENNVPYFEENVLVKGITTFYVPDGFRYIKFLRLTPRSEHLDAIYHAREALEECLAEVDAANTALTEAVMAGTDQKPVADSYKAAREKADRAQAALDEARGMAEADYEPLAEIIRAALADGADFDTMIATYGIEDDSITPPNENGYPFHPDTAMWNEDFAAAVSLLETNGEVSKPIFSENSIYIVQRGEDIPAGAQEPGEDFMPSLREELLYELQVERLNELVDLWAPDMDITVDLTGLVFPEY